MGVDKKVIKIRNILNEKPTDTSVVDLLKQLQGFAINVQTLKNTSIGRTVNVVRKLNKNKEVVILCETLIKNWKKCLTHCNTANDPSSCSSKTKKQTKKDDKYASSTTISTRLKSKEMLLAALNVDNRCEGCTNPKELAERLEETIYQEFKNTGRPYMNRIRSRIANLKDANNPELRKNFCAGVITVARMAIMTAEEMASEKMKVLRDQLNKEAINNAQLATGQGTASEFLKCDKCKKRNCSYHQLQTLSSDEPMTTFVYCHECGNRWQFN